MAIDKVVLGDVAALVGEVRTFVFDGDIDFGDQSPADFIDMRVGPAWDRLVSESKETNLVTTVGRQQMTKVIVGESTALCGYVALSTSVITPAFADTTLPTEKVRNAVTSRASYLSVYQRYQAYFTTTSFGSTGINSEGLFDTATTGGAMWADASITVSKSTTQSLLVDHRIQATTG